MAGAIREAAQRLLLTSDTARLDAEVLMAHALCVDRSRMLISHMTSAPPPSFADLVERRLRSEPVAYITGVQEFYGREFAVTPDVLIPRADSEVLIEAAAGLSQPPRRVLDLGTGSGALLLSVLCECPGSEGAGIDQSARALEVSRRNAQTLGVDARSSWIIGDWTKDGWSDDIGTFDLIVCNPPYVEADAELARDVRGYEPADALFAGADGLSDYRILIPQLRSLMTVNAAAILEIGHAQDHAVTEIAAAAGFSTEMRRDLANRPRALILS